VADFEGDLCQKRKNPCKNAGKFEKEEASGKMLCFCPSGFTGVYCEKKCKKVEKFFDIVFVLDGSGSLDMGGTAKKDCSYPNPIPFNNELEFIDDVIDTLKIGKTASRAAVVQFAQEVMTEVSLVESGTLGKTKLMSKVSKIDWRAKFALASDLGGKQCAEKNIGYTTATPEAMAHAQRLLKAEGRMSDKNVVKMVFVLTDGEISAYLKKSNDKRDALKIAQDLNKMGVQTYSIGVGLASSSSRNSGMKQDLLDMAGGNEAHRFMVTSFADLKRKVLGTIQNTLNCDV